MANAMMGDESGLTLPVTMEGASSGATPAARLSIFGSGLAAAGIAGTGTPEQVFEWVPQCYGDADDVKLGAYCVSEPDAGSDVARCAPAWSTSRPRTSGSSTARRA